MRMIPMTTERIENRIIHLQQKPVENEKLIKKWQRLLRNFNGKE